MSELEQTARKIGFLLEGYAQATDNQVLRAWARELMASSLPENQSPHDSTETVEKPDYLQRNRGSDWDSTLSIDDTKVDPDELFVGDGPTVEPVQPMTDLSGIDHSPAFEGYQPNGGGQANPDLVGGVDVRNWPNRSTD